MCDLHLCIVNYTLIGCHVAILYHSKYSRTLHVHCNIDYALSFRNKKKMKQKGIQTLIRSLNPNQNEEKRHKNSWGAHK